MKRFARKVGSVAAEIFVDPVEVDGRQVPLTEIHSPELLATLVEVGDEVQAGWLWNESTESWGAPPEAPPAIPPSLADTGHGNPPAAEEK